MQNVVTEHEARANLVEALKCIMTFRGITQRQLAKAVGRTKMTINRMCRGENLPNVALVAAVAEVLGYQVEDLIVEPAKIRLREELRAGREKSLISA